MSETYEQELIKSAIDGDETAWKTLCNSYRSEIYACANSFLKNHQDAEDCTQDTFTKAFISLSTLRGSSLKYWLLRIARNHALDQLDRQKKQPLGMDPFTDAEKTLERVAGSTKTPEQLEDAVLEEKQLEFAKQAVDKLPHGQKRDFKLFLEGYNPNEIKNITEKNYKTVYDNIKGARRNLRKAGATFATILAICARAYSASRWFLSAGLRIAKTTTVSLTTIHKAYLLTLVSILTTVLLNWVISNSAPNTPIYTRKSTPAPVTQVTSPKQALHNNGQQNSISPRTGSENKDGSKSNPGISAEVDSKKSSVKSENSGEDLTVAITKPTAQSTYRLMQNVPCEVAVNGVYPPRSFWWSFDDNLDEKSDSKIFSASDLSSETKIIHSFTVPGVHNLAVWVDDIKGHKAQSSRISFIVEDIEVLRAKLSANRDLHEFETLKTFRFSAIILGGLPPYTYSWDFGDHIVVVNSAQDIVTVSSQETVADLRARTKQDVVVCTAQDGVSGTCIEIVHTYKSDDDYWTTLRVTDATDAQVIETLPCTVKNGGQPPLHDDK